MSPRRVAADVVYSLLVASCPLTHISAAGLTACHCRLVLILSVSRVTNMTVGETRELSWTVSLR